MNIRGNIFADASVDTMIACMKKNILSDSVIIHENTDEIFSKLCSIKKEELLVGDIIINYEMFLNSETLPLIQKIEKKSQPLIEYIDISNGIVAYKK